MIYFVWIVAVFLMLALVADALTTIKLIGDEASKETNPVMRWLMTKMGVKPALLATRALAIMVILAMAQYLPYWATIPIFIFFSGLYSWQVYKHILSLNMSGGG